MSVLHDASDEDARDERKREKLRAAGVELSECGRFWFDENAAQAAVDFFSTRLRFTAGEWAGELFQLSEWQEKDIIRPAFGWKRLDGTRRYRRVFIWVPRKNGKTELAAGCALILLVADGEMGGQVYSIASDKKQAKVVFDRASSMVAWDKQLSGYLTVLKTSIFCQELQASFLPLSGRAAGKHGLNMSGLVGDEVHEWRSGDLYTYVHQSVGSRRQPLEFLISTAGNRSGYGWEQWQHCQKVLNGETEDESTLVVVYAADPDDDWTSPETWRKANPNLGISVKESYLREECQRAMENPRLENDFKRYHLNMWTQQAVRWLPLHQWDICGHPEDGIKQPSDNKRWADLEKLLLGRKCFAGVDLSATADLTCSVLWFPAEEPNDLNIILPRFFMPEENLVKRSRQDAANYEAWAAQGALMLTPGNVVDYTFVREALFRDGENFDLKKVAIDRWNATHFAQELAEEGLDVAFFGQGYASMNAPSKEFERLFLKAAFDHGGHPVLRYCAGNVAIQTDAAGNIKPAKDLSTGRIDGIVGSIMALGAASQVEEKEMNLDGFLSNPVIYS